MISIETERKLAEVFLKISSAEGQVEDFRFALSSCEEFDPFSTFRALDRLGSGGFSSTDFLSILERHHFFTTNDEAYLSIKQYDTQQLGRLSISEFLQLVLPSTCPGLRSQAEARQGRFSSQVESLAIKLLQAEVMYHRVCENSKKSLLIRHDFSVLECFRAIDIRNLGYIDRKILFDFLRRHQNISQQDIDAIFRRVDNDADDLLNYHEFVECLMPSQVSTVRSLKAASFNSLASPRHSFNQVKDQISRIETSPLKGSGRKSLNYQSSTFASSMKSVFSTSPRRSSPLRSLRQGLKGKRQLSPVKSSNLNISSRSTNGVRRPSPSKSLRSNPSPLRASCSTPNPSASMPYAHSSIFQSIDKTPQPRSEERELVLWFQEEIKISRDIEKKKNELSLKHDFNIPDAFRLFDQSDSGLVTLPDLQETFTYFNFSAPKDEIYLLLKHYSNCGQLNISEFSEMISPKQEEYNRILRNRSSNMPESDFPLFSSETLKTFLEMFRLMLDAESLAERVRQKLSRMPDFSLYQAFMAVDKDRNGFITIDEFQRILNSHNIFASSKDLQSLMGKYDKNRDGRVSYTDFVQEITPKSPRRF